MDVHTYVHMDNASCEVTIATEKHYVLQVLSHKHLDENTCSNTVCAIQFATKGIRYFGSLNTSSDSSNMLMTFSGHHSKVPDHLIQH